MQTEVGRLISDWMHQPVTPEQHKNLFSCWLLLKGVVFLTVLVSLTPPLLSVAVASTIKSCLVQNIYTSLWSPPSPSPRGITVLPNGHLLVSDATVNDCQNGFPPVYWYGVNLFETDTAGTLLATATTFTNPSGSCSTRPSGGPSNFSFKPTGVAVNPTNKF